MNSRQKGARGERQWRDELRAQGYAARRGQQFSGSPDSPDVVCDALPWIHFEVKAVEKLNIYDAMEQAIRDAGKSEVRSLKSEGNHLTPAHSPRGGEGEGSRLRKVPIVAHRRNFRPWMITMTAETFFRFLRGDFYKEPKREGSQEGQE